MQSASRCARPGPGSPRRLTSSIRPAASRPAGSAWTPARRRPSTPSSAKATSSSSRPRANQARSRARRAVPYPLPIEGEGQGEGDPLKMKKRSDKEHSEREEDRLLIRFAADREQSFDRRKALTHKQVWSDLL